METKSHPVELLMKLNNLDRVKFISIKNYKNQQGEISNYTLIAAFDYERARQKDIVRLLAVSYDNPVKELVRREMLASLMDNADAETRSNASQAQIDAYRHIGKNSKIHKESLSIKIFAFQRSKKVIQPVAYKPVKHGVKAIYRKEITNECRLSTAKYRQFTLTQIQSTVINGESLEIVH